MFSMFLSYDFLVLSLLRNRFHLEKHSLKIEPIFKNDSGRYSCRVRNNRGEDWLNFSITVTGGSNEHHAVVVSDVAFVRAFGFYEGSNHFSGRQNLMSHFN